jgi:two-component system, chemotaxis family, protein-glutamate methylesterase/glutaminase
MEDRPLRAEGGEIDSMAQIKRDIIVVGASAGGVQALQRLVGGFSADLPAAIFVVLHLWPGRESYLASILERSTALKVAEAQDGAPIEHGRIYVARTDFHLFVERERMLVLRGPQENRARPAINPLFRSAAMAYGRRVIGVLLTGMLDDGVAGLWAIKQCGGVAVVQSDAEFPQMPEAAIDNVAVDHHVPLTEIAPLVNRLVHEPVDAIDAVTTPEVVRTEHESAKMKTVGIDLDHVGKRTVFTCPECAGPLWELDEGELHYRCHVGHAYSGEILAAAQETNIEGSLWSAVRALKESAELDRRLAERSAEHGLADAATAHRKNAKEKVVQVEQLQHFLATRRTVVVPKLQKSRRD